MRIPQSVLKTMSYGTMHMTIAILVAYALSGSWHVALAIGLVEPCIQTCAFFFHEKAWHRAEAKNKASDHHDSVIDSTSPANRVIEAILTHKH
jgi:uncharacterized membrane protein